MLSILHFLVFIALDFRGCKRPYLQLHLTLDLYVYLFGSTLELQFENNEIGSHFVSGMILYLSFQLLTGKMNEIGRYDMTAFKIREQGRNKCLSDLISLFGSVPLAATSMKAVDA